MKKAVFTEPVIRGLRNWHKIARKSAATSKNNSLYPSRDTSTQNSPRSSLAPPPTYDAGSALIHEETEVVAPDHPLPDVSVHVKEEEKDLHNEEKEAIYNGEVSFAMYK